MKHYKYSEFSVYKILFLSLAYFTFCQFASAKDIVVSAAISLSDAFKDIAKLYKVSHPQDKILYNFAASGSLLQQISEGAPVDLFASADENTMNIAQQKGFIIPYTRCNFINNYLVLITSRTNHLVIHQLSDLNQPTIHKIALGKAITVPAGSYTQKTLEKARLWQKLQNKFIPAQNVRQVLSYVARNEVDVGFVYESDAKLFSDKVKILFRVPLLEPVQYPVALVKNSPNQKQAQEFIQLLLSKEGQAVLQRYGFSNYRLNGN